MIGKQAAYSVFREEANKIVKKGTPHASAEGMENSEYFFTPIAAVEAFDGDERFLNPEGTPLTLIRKSTGEVVHLHFQTDEWGKIVETITPVNYITA